MSYLNWICVDCGNAFDAAGNGAVGAVTCPACGSAEVKDAKKDTASKAASSDSCTPRG